MIQILITELELKLVKFLYFFAGCRCIHAQTKHAADVQGNWWHDQHSKWRTSSQSTAEQGRKLQTMCKWNEHFDQGQANGDEWGSNSGQVGKRRFSFKKFGSRNIHVDFSWAQQVFGKNLQEAVSTEGWENVNIN